MERSKFLSLKARDLLSGAFLAFISSLGMYALNILNIMQETGQIEFSWESLQSALITALGVFGAYLIKNLLSNSEGTPLAKEKK